MPLVSQIFSCTQCGYCCHGETTVSLNADDRIRMVEALHRDEDTVRRMYWRVTGNTVQMKTVDGHCIFYENGCKVHEGRPWRCGQWPLHPAILEDESNFHTIAESCPGINKDISYQQFCEILKNLLNNGNFRC